MNEEAPITPRRVGRPAGAGKQAAAAKPKNVPRQAANPVKEPAAPAANMADRSGPTAGDAAPSWDDAVPALMTRRSRKSGEGIDNWSEVPKDMKDPGWDYEWRVLRVLAKDTPGAEKSFWYEQSWRPVPAKGKWLKMCEPGYEGKYVERMDQMLMMRPAHLSEEARREDFEIAEEQKWNKLEAASAVPTGRPGIVAHRDKMEIDIVVGSKAEKSAAPRQ